MKRFFTRGYLLMLYCLMCTACSTLSPIRTYTGASGRGLAVLKEVDASFVGQCEDNCRDRDLAENRINRLPCNCEDSKKADSVNILLYKAVIAYISSLGKLAEPGLATMPARALSASLTATPIIRVTAQEVDAYNTLSDLIAQAMTRNYRQQQLKNYMVSAHVPFKTLLNALQLNLGKNLSGTIAVRKQRVRADYYELLSHRQNSAYEKRKITEDFYQLTAHLDKHQQHLHDYSSILEEIKTGHQQIYEHLDHLSNAQLQVALQAQAAKIDDLIAKISKK